MNFNRISVKQLRRQFENKKCEIPQDPGVYRWWFPEQTALNLLKSLNGVDNNSVMKENIDGKECWCLYFGISKDLKQRIKWHVTQHHTDSSVKSGFLSTLRQTISAMLLIDETKSEEAVNDVMDQCYWDWCATPTHNDAKQIETETLSKGYYPLNVQGNKGVDPSIVNQLKQLRKTYKK